MAKTRYYIKFYTFKFPFKIITYGRMCTRTKKSCIKLALKQIRQRKAFFFVMHKG